MGAKFRSWMIGVGLAPAFAAPLMASTNQEFDSALGGRAIPTDSAPLSPSQQQKLASQFKGLVEKCWIVPPVIQAIPDAGPISAIVSIEFDRDGHLVGEPQIVAVEAPTKGLEAPLTASGVKDALSSSVIRAVKRCTPLNFVAEYRDSYAVWRNIRVKFIVPRP